MFRFLRWVLSRRAFLGGTTASLGTLALAAILGEESIAFHEVDFSSNRPWEGSFSFHDPSQHEAWRERMAWNAQLIDQLLEEAEAAQLPVAFLYIPAYQVFLRELSVGLSSSFSFISESDTFVS